MSTDPFDAPTGEAGGALAELLARQARLREWIERLDDPQDDVPAHVTARVRADYEARLTELVGELRAHADALRADAVERREALLSAREAREAAADALAEGRLRHRLGEVDDAEWGARRGELERTASDSEAREREAGEELARLEELLSQIDAPASQGGDPVTADVAPSSESSEDARDSGWEWTPEPEAAEETGAGGAPGFLDDLDRAISAEESELDTRPAPGVKCPECGYTNDSTAWYCGVCGVDLT